MPDNKKTKFGEVAIVGRPNVGKSTLLNALVGEKLSITSVRPHTTRHRVLGILNNSAGQAVFVDTPGHERRSDRALHRLMGRVIHQVLETCDLVLLLIEATGLTDADKVLFDLLGERVADTILVINKVDRLHRREELLPFLETLQKYKFKEYVPISAQRGLNLNGLIATIFDALPEGPVMYPKDVTTDRNLLFRAAELIREQLLAVMYQEVPYGLTVEVEHIREETGLCLIHGLIWLDRESHKPIVIGRQGRQLKQVGTAARLELEKLFKKRVHLELWVKVREHWSDSDNELRRLGFEV